MLCFTSLTSQFLSMRDEAKHSLPQTMRDDAFSHSVLLSVHSCVVCLYYIIIFFSSFQCCCCCVLLQLCFCIAHCFMFLLLFLFDVHTHVLPPSDFVRRVGRRQPIAGSFLGIAPCCAVMSFALVHVIFISGGRLVIRFVLINFMLLCFTIVSMIALSEPCSRAHCCFPFLAPM